ncbi:flagellar brake protein [Porticoccaceae bacterium LTM1]|nr:flagellar brake protein [Porticoccaceae bacterium LTM1]
MAGPNEGDDITLPSRIAALLTELQEGRALLNASIPGRQGSFATSVLSVDRRKSRLVFDELNPLAGHKALLETGKLRLTAQLRQVKLRFAVELISTGEDDRGAYYITTLPNSIHHAQKREYFRTPIRINERLQATLTSAGGNELVGSVIDLSVGGAGLLFERDIKLEKGDYFPAMVIELPDYGTFECPVFIRHTKTADHSDQLRVGIQFSGVNPALERALQKAVAYLQRRMLKP